MGEIFELNRLEYMILETLYNGNCKDYFHGMTVTEIQEDNEGALGARMTIWKKAKRLLSAGYVEKGVLDNHADTYFLSKKGIKIVEGGTQK